MKSSEIIPCMYIRLILVVPPYIPDIPGLFILQGLQSSNPISLISLDYLYYRDCSPPTLSLISLDYLYYRLDYLYYRDYSPPTLYLWYPWTIYITGTLVLQPYISDIPGLFILQGLQSSNPISLIFLDYLYYRGCSPPTLYLWYPWTIYFTGTPVLQPYIPDIPGLFILKGLQSSNPISLIYLDYLYFRGCSPPTLYPWYTWTIYITGAAVI